MELNIDGYIVLIDDEDWPIVSGLKWKVMKCAKHVTNYVWHRSSAGLPRGKVRMILLHRYVLGLVKGDPEVDHIDGNGLNNTKINLRCCSHAENVRNRRLNRNSSSGYKGVYKNGKSEKWRARITLNGHRRGLGTFDSPEDAHRAYVAAAKDLHGAFYRAK